jgi:hypothetical protein
MNADDVLGMAMAKVLLIVRDHWVRLPNELGGTVKAAQWGEAKAIAEAYVDALTSGGTKPYAGRDAAALKAELVNALKAGRWPELPAGTVSGQMSSPFEGRTQPISG